MLRAYAEEGSYWPVRARLSEADAEAENGGLAIGEGMEAADGYMGGNARPVGRDRHGSAAAVAAGPLLLPGLVDRVHLIDGEGELTVFVETGGDEAEVDAKLVEAVVRQHGLVVDDDGGEERLALVVLVAGDLLEMCPGICVRGCRPNSSPRLP